jgi:hypothetical protein
MHDSGLCVGNPNHTPWALHSLCNHPHPHFNADVAKKHSVTQPCSRWTQHELRLISWYRACSHAPFSPSCYCFSCKKAFGLPPSLLLSASSEHPIMERWRMDNVWWVAKELKHLSNKSIWSVNTTKHWGVVQSNGTNDGTAHRIIALCCPTVWDHAVTTTTMDCAAINLVWQFACTAESSAAVYLFHSTLFKIWGPRVRSPLEICFVIGWVERWSGLNWVWATSEVAPYTG